MRIGIFDQYPHDIAGAQIFGHIAQQHLPVDFGGIGLRPASRADVAVFVRLAYLVDDDR